MSTQLDPENIKKWLRHVVANPFAAATAPGTRESAEQICAWIDEQAPSSQDQEAALKFLGTPELVTELLLRFQGRGIVAYVDPRHVHVNGMPAISYFHGKDRPYEALGIMDVVAKRIWMALNAAPPDPAGDFSEAPE